MSALSQLLNERLPDGWTGDTIVKEATKHGQKINRATAYSYLAGDHAAVPRETVLKAFAAVLPKTTVEELRDAAKVPTGEAEPWLPPTEADRLNRRQRKAVEELIKAIVAAPAGAVDGSVQWAGAATGHALPDTGSQDRTREFVPDDDGQSEGRAQPPAPGARGRRRKA